MAVSKYTSWEDVPIFLDVKEAGEVLGVHFNTIKKLIRDDRLPAKKVGRAYRINREDLRNYMATDK